MARTISSDAENMVTGASLVEYNAVMDTRRFRIRPGQRVDLARYDTADTRPFHDKKAIAGHDAGSERLARLQEQLYAQDRWAVLLIFQGMDAAGKDSAIKHVMGGLNPQ